MTWKRGPEFFKARNNDDGREPHGWFAVVWVPDDGPTKTHGYVEGVDPTSAPDLLAVLEAQGHEEASDGHGSYCAACVVLPNPNGGDEQWPCPASIAIDRARGEAAYLTPDVMAKGLLQEPAEPNSDTLTDEQRKDLGLPPATATQDKGEGSE